MFYWREDIRRECTTHESRGPRLRDLGCEDSYQIKVHTAGCRIAAVSIIKGRHGAFICQAQTLGQEREMK